MSLPSPTTNPYLGVPEAEPASARLFVTKVPQTATREDVAAYFARFGVTTDVYLPSVPGVPGHKGIAFVSYSDPAVVQLALAHGPHEIQGHEVVVDVAAPRGAQPPGQGGADPLQEQQPSADRLFVTKVPPALQREHLREHFAQFGELTDVYLPQVPGGGAHKGICFVSFADPNALRLALQHSPHEVCGHPVVVDVAAPRGPAPGGTSLPGVPAPGAPRAPPSLPGGQGCFAAAAAAAAAGALGYAAGGMAGAPGYASAATTPVPSSFANTTGVPVPGRLFVTRVTPDMTKVDLQLYFQQFGQLDDVYIPNGGKGIAFVSFRDAIASQRVLQAQQHFVKPGKAVVVDQALDRPPLGARSGGFLAFGAVPGVGARQPTRFGPY